MPSMLGERTVDSDGPPVELDCDQSSLRGAVYNLDSYGVGSGIL